MPEISFSVVVGTPKISTCKVAIQDCCKNKFDELSKVVMVPSFAGTVGRRHGIIRLRLFFFKPSKVQDMRVRGMHLEACCHLSVVISVFLSCLQLSE